MIKKHNIVIAADPFYQHLPYHTYLLSIDGIPRYAGKGSGSISRPQAHMRRMRDIDFANPFAIWEILRFFEEEDQAIVHEKALIKQYGRLDIGTGTLFNKTNGGERGGGRGYAVLVEWAHCDIVPLENLKGNPIQGIYKNAYDAARTIYGSTQHRRIISRRCEEGGGSFGGYYFERIDENFIRRQLIDDLLEF